MITDTETFMDIADRSGVRGGGRRLADACQFAALADGRLTLDLAPARDWSLRPEHQNALRAALARELGEPLRLEIHIGRECTA